MGDSTHQMTESVAVAGADYPTVEQEAAHASPSLPSADTKKERERARKKAQRSKKRTQLATKRQEAAAAAVSEGAAAAVESQVEGAARDPERPYGWHLRGMNWPRGMLEAAGLRWDPVNGLTSIEDGSPQWMLPGEEFRDGR